MLCARISSPSSMASSASVTALNSSLYSGDSSGNDFSLLAPLVGEKTADAFVKFFRAQRELGTLGAYTDAELQRFSAARKYQLAQQCLYLAAAKPAEARALVARLGAEYAAWFEYVLTRKQKM